MKRFAVSLVALAAALAAGAAAAKEFVYGTPISARHSLHPSTMEPFFEAVKKETKNAIEWRMVANAQIVRERNALEGVRDMIVDGAMIVPVSHRKELSAHNLLWDMQVFGTDPVAVTGAVTETTLLNCPQCLEQYKKQNTV